MQRRHANTEIPEKHNKKTPLSAAGKKSNRAISSERAACENVTALLKRFKIIAERYRNRRRRVGLRFFLIAALYNMELEAAWRLRKRSNIEYGRFKELTKIIGCWRRRVAKRKGWSQ